MRIKRMFAIMLCVIAAGSAMIWIKARNMRLERQAKEMRQHRNELSVDEQQLADIVTGFGSDSGGDNSQVARQGEGRESDQTTERRRR